MCALYVFLKRSLPMKKKIAAFANGWSDEYLIEALKGVKK